MKIGDEIDALNERLAKAKSALTTLGSDTGNGEMRALLKEQVRKDIADTLRELNMTMVTVFFRGGRTTTVTRSHAARLVEIHGGNVSIEGAAFAPLEDDAQAAPAAPSAGRHIGMLHSVSDRKPSILTSFFGMNFNWIIASIGSGAPFALLGLLLPLLSVFVTVSDPLK
jgi:hypothetical protein